MYFTEVYLGLSASRDHQHHIDSGLTIMEPLFCLMHIKKVYKTPMMLYNSLSTHG